jgi:hypothetical protein
MAAKGTESKELVLEKLKELFPSSFMYDKEFRIPFTENGEEIQIKVSLTCAKVNVDHETSTTLASPVTNSPKVTTGEFNFDSGFPAPKPQEPTKKVVEMTEAEKDNVMTLLERLGF